MPTATLDLSGAGTEDLPAIERRQLELGQKLNQMMLERKLESYRVWPKQFEFHAAGRMYRERLFRAVNQCQVATAIIETAGGERRISELIGETGFAVRSWDGESRRVAQASPVYLRGIEQAFRLHLDNGRAFECSGRHQVFDSAGCWRMVDQLVQQSDGLRWSHATRDWMASCGEDVRQHGWVLRLPPDISQSLLPSAGDAHRRIPSCVNEDGAEPTRAHSRVCRSCGHRPSSDDARRFSALVSAWQDQAPSHDAGWSLHELQALRRSRAELCRNQSWPGPVHRQAPLGSDRSDVWDVSRGVADMPARCCTRGRNCGQFPVCQGPGHSGAGFLWHAQGTETFFPSAPIPLFNSLHIVAVESIGLQPIVDFGVERFHAYWGSGALHHNCGKSYAGCAEDALHLTGAYPSWWPGYVFDRPTRGWLLSESLAFSRDTVQKLLLGASPSEWGTGLLPKYSIRKIAMAQHSVADTVDHIYVDHVSNARGLKGCSIILFKSAEMERNRLGGDTLDWVHVDEEPPGPHYEEVMTRTNISQGPIYTTMTPLKGGTVLINRFIDEPAKGSADIRWTLDDENHYTLEQKEAIKEQYRNSPQYEARVNANPIRGAGVIYPFPKDRLEIDPFEIPDHWARICGADFGLAHPQTLVWCAWDRDTDVFHVYDVYAVAHEPNVAVHVSAWKRGGDYIPVAYPHDGENETASGQGIALADQWRREGALMLGEPAMLPETGNEFEQIRGRKSVEMQTRLILNAMTSGKIRVFKHLERFWKEYQTYHRQENGQIHKKFDDVLDAFRYAWVMRRYAVTKWDRQNMYSAIAGYRPNWRT